jgi:hypothetical protein
MPATDAKLVASVGKEIKRRDLGSQHRGIVVRQHMHQCAKLDALRALRALREEREWIGRSAEFWKEEVLDNRVRRISQAVGVHDLLERLRVDLFLRLARPALKLRINAELHDRPFPAVVPKSKRLARNRHQIRGHRRVLFANLGD